MHVDQYSTERTFSVFLVAYFTEMYGLPLTSHLLSGWWSSRFPGVDWLNHVARRLLEAMSGSLTDPHFDPFHVASFNFVGEFSGCSPGARSERLKRLSAT